MLTIRGHENDILGGLWISCSDHNSWNIVSRVLSNRNTDWHQRLSGAMLQIQCKMSRDATFVSNPSLYSIYANTDKSLVSISIHWYSAFMHLCNKLVSRSKSQIVNMQTTGCYRQGGIWWYTRGVTLVILQNNSWISQCEPYYCIYAGRWGN